MNRTILLAQMTGASPILSLVPTGGKHLKGSIHRNSMTLAKDFKGRHI